MKADAVDLLMTKGQFQTEQALAMAEAIDMTVSNAELVTVPVLDARFLAFESKVNRRFAEADARMDRYFAEMDIRFTALETKLDTILVVTDNKFVTLEARMGQKFERLRLQLFIATFIGYVVMSLFCKVVMETIRHAF